MALRCLHGLRWRVWGRRWFRLLGRQRRRCPMQRPMQRHPQAVPGSASQVLRHRPPSWYGLVPRARRWVIQPQQHPPAQIDHHLRTADAPGRQRVFGRRCGPPGPRHPRSQTPFAAIPGQARGWDGGHAPAPPACRQGGQARQDDPAPGVQVVRSHPTLAQPDRHHHRCEGRHQRRARTPQRLGAQLHGGWRWPARHAQGDALDGLSGLSNLSGLSGVNGCRSISGFCSSKGVCDAAASLPRPAPSSPGPQEARRNTSVPLVPPKPKLFFTATSIFICRASLAQ